MSIESIKICSVRLVAWKGQAISFLKYKSKILPALFMWSLNNDWKFYGSWGLKIEIF